MIRLQALEDRIPAVKEALRLPRTWHRQWLARTFAEFLPELRSRPITTGSSVCSRPRWTSTPGRCCGGSRACRRTRQPAPCGRCWSALPGAESLKHQEKTMSTTLDTPSRFLFVMWEGGGNVAPQLALARKLVQRGHRVRVLADPCIREEVEAVGGEWIPFRRAPHRVDRSLESDIVRDWEARSPLGAFAQDRIMFGPALHTPRTCWRHPRRGCGGLHPVRGGSGRGAGRSPPGTPRPQRAADAAAGGARSWPRLSADAWSHRAAAGCRLRVDVHSHLLHRALKAEPGTCEAGAGADSHRPRGVRARRPGAGAQQPGIRLRLRRSAAEPALRGSAAGRSRLGGAVALPLGGKSPRSAGGGGAQHHLPGPGRPVAKGDRRSRSATRAGTGDHRPLGGPRHAAGPRQRGRAPLRMHRYSGRRMRWSRTPAMAP